MCLINCPNQLKIPHCIKIQTMCSSCLWGSKKGRLHRSEKRSGSAAVAKCGWTNKCVTLNINSSPFKKRKKATDSFAMNA